MQKEHNNAALGTIKTQINATNAKNTRVHKNKKCGAVGHNRIARQVLQVSPACIILCIVIRKVIVLVCFFFLKRGLLIILSIILVFFPPSSKQLKRLNHYGV